MVKNLLVSIGSCIAVLLLLEGLARLHFLLDEVDLEALPEYFADTDGYLRFDPVLGWSLKPGYKHNGIQVNSLGLRSSLDDIETDCRGKRRILLLGDSMLFGLGMPQHLIFSEILNSQSEDYCFINIRQISSFLVSPLYCL